MQSTMQDAPLLIRDIIRHGQWLYADKKIFTVSAEGVHEATFLEVSKRAERLANALVALGVSEGDRVATFMWNNQSHMEAYLAVPAMGAVLHTLNFHLRDDFSIPNVALRLWERPENAEELPEFAAVSEELQVFAETLNQPYCGSTAGFETSSWFGAASPHVRSQALIAMRNGGGTIGLIALGSEDAQRFFAGMGTLYLERLGEMASAALARVLR